VFESAIFHRRPYRPALTESPIVASKMIRSTAIVMTPDEGVDTERVSVHAIQTTRRRADVNMSRRFQ